MLKLRLRREGRLQGRGDPAWARSRWSPTAAPSSSTAPSASSVSQLAPLARASAFEESARTPAASSLHAFRIIPDRGTWLEVQFDNNDLLYVYLDRRRRRRKFLITTLLRAIGYSADIDILNLFYEITRSALSKALDLEDVGTFVLVEDDPSTSQRAWSSPRPFEPLTSDRPHLREDTTSPHDPASSTPRPDEGAIIRALARRTRPATRRRPSKEILQAPPPRASRRRPPTRKALLNACSSIRSATTSAASAATRLNQKLGLKVDLEQRILEPERRRRGHQSPRPPQAGRGRRR
jgi:DNA-directed RNA polymerase subunit beta